MFRHVVMFRWSPEASAAQKNRGASALGELPGAIPTVRAYRCGPDAAVNPGNFDYIVVADFDDVAGYLTYRDHPAHRAVVAEHIAPILAERAAVQYQLED